MASSHSSTPTSARSTGQYPTKSKAKSPSTNEPIFTASMQDAQARGKDPYEVDEGDSSCDERDSRFDAYGNGSYEATKRRRDAAAILDSPEILMMFAQSRGDLYVIPNAALTPKM
ncbi:hypothetical protein B7494_g2535 [Chlorociboria aeruginascens]|nr:hypothetical protein B7494_g2535 [Chlorociboria aeruginascens]